MAKRRVHAIDSDDEVAHSSPLGSKRARTEDSDDEVQEVHAGPARRDAKGKGKAVQQDENDSDVGIVDQENEDNEDDEPQAPQPIYEDDDEKFEEEHEDTVRAALEAKRKVQGGIAEHGIIESIEMHQFMCHRYLTFTFGPQINFIIGHNGSGKSAVLTAITVALGGKASSTGRGTGLKSFIREGQSAAEVTITLKNQGEEAYKPQDYGPSIVITRKFTKEGSSSWKIKSQSGKIISTKREELSAICDHMNIQVDNPMNVLTQDAARQFLSASGPQEKYKFFLRGTQLTQLSEEYDLLHENITQTSRVLQQKKQAIPDLRTAFREATLRFEEASKAREQKRKADELKKEMAWAHVAAKEDEMRDKYEELAKLQRRLPKIQDSVLAAETKLKEANDEVTNHEAELRNLGDIASLLEERRKFQDQLRAKKAKLVELKNEQKQMNENLQGVKKQIEDYERKITEETRRMETHTQAKRDETMSKLLVAKAEVDNASSRVKEIAEREATQKTENDHIRQEGKEVEAGGLQKEARIREINDMIKKCKEQQNNILTPYGHNIKELLDRIGRATWYGEKPLGPLGLHVKIKQSELWARDVLRSLLAHLLTAFAITDSRDRPQLKRLLDSTRNHGISVIISARDMFDYRSGEPPPDKLTVLRALEITDEFVLRILINSATIERNLLARSRRIGEEALDSLRSGTAFTADWFRVNKFTDGASSVRLQPLGPTDPRNLLFSGSDTASSIQQYETELATVHQEVQAARQKWQELQQAHKLGQTALEKIKTEGHQANATFQEARRRHAALQEEANEELPAGIVGLEAAKSEAEIEKESIMVQFAELQVQKTKFDDGQKVLITSRDECQAKIDAFEEKRRAISGRAEEAAAARAKAQNDLEHYNRKLTDENGKIKEVEQIAQVLEAEFSNWTTKALEFCERFEKPRKVADVKRNLEAVQAALRERERTQGATVEEMTVEVNKAKASLQAAEKELKGMTSLNHALKQSHQIRTAKWHEFRRHIALRCKLVFTYQLSHRGYYGKVLFDHSAATLQLKVQTDDQAGTQAREKDARSLSGGEKSFSTICLLQSLWDAIGCPLRCLDEFDVFMDAVNRRISMKMMIDTANNSDKKQYILITPQDMTNIHPGKTVRVNRMRDPERERGQPTLTFNS